VLKLVYSAVADVATVETDQDIINQGRQAALEGKHISDHPFQDPTCYALRLWVEGFREVCIHQER